MVALKLADAADAISRERYQALDLVVTTKPDKTPVTDADRAVERAIIGTLAEERPHDAILGEEFGEQTGQASGSEVGGAEHPHRQWIIDPIDGTSNFLRGVPVWATLIALAVDGVPVVGVVSAPALGKRWWGSVGGGAWLTEGDHKPRRLGVSAVSALADASISYNSLQQWDQAGYLDKLIGLSRKVWRTRAYGDMWSYMMLAEGVLDAVAEFDLKPYDMAALIPIVREAGGRFSSVDGHNDCWHGSALATNGHLHNDLLEALRR
jgi:histidinol-phosphatase